MRRSFVVCLILCSTLALFGEDYYVSTNGDNANEGSYEEPFRSVQYAIAQIDPGDFIYLMGGTYYEAATITISAGELPPVSLWVYPNPASEQIMLEISSAKETSGTVNLIDISGRIYPLSDGIIYFNTQSNFTFDLSGIASGWYILEILTEQQRVYEKLIIN